MDPVISHEDDEPEGWVECTGEPPRDRRPQYPVGGDEGETDRHVRYARHERRNRLVAGPTESRQGRVHRTERDGYEGGDDEELKGKRSGLVLLPEQRDDRKVRQE